MDTLLENFITQWGPLGLVTWLLWDLLKTNLTRHETLIRQIIEYQRQNKDAITAIDKRLDKIQIELLNVENFLIKDGFKPSETIKQVLNKE